MNSIMVILTIAFFLFSALPDEGQNATEIDAAQIVDETGISSAAADSVPAVGSLSEGSEASAETLTPKPETSSESSQTESEGFTQVEENEAGMMAGF